jgi:sulfatase modifying factor 1
VLLSILKKLLPLYYLTFIVISCNNSNSSNNASKLAYNADTLFGVNAAMANIKTGKYIPLYGKDSQLVTINSFQMDILPVTNANYLDFVKTNKRWRKSNIKKIFADDNYLIHWKNDTTIGNEMNKNSAVTNVSWYAAKAYCECQGKRMPTVNEWEFVAMANENIADARKIASFNQQILAWYEKPNTNNKSVGKSLKNYWGINDLHGLVWEWTSDFSSILLTDESKNDSSINKKLFCGSGKFTKTDLMNYAAFMRYAFRGSLKANYTLQNLGFRCVKDSMISNEK